MTLTQKDTKNLVNAVVKALDPKFKRIDEQFEQVDQRFEQVDQRFEQVDKRFDQISGRFEQIDGQFKNMSLEIGTMFKQLATKDELHHEVSRIDQRMDEQEVRLNELAGSMAVFETRVINRFDDLDEKISKHDEKFEQIMKQVGRHSATLQNHVIRLIKLEKDA